MDCQCWHKGVVQEELMRWVARILFSPVRKRKSLAYLLSAQLVHKETREGQRFSEKEKHLNVQVIA
jgi:hypothetical protein